MCNEQTIQQTDFANQLITKQAAIDALGEKPLVWDDLSDFDLGKAAQWSDDVDAIKALPTAQPEIIRCKDCRWGREACGNIECFADTNVPPEYHGYEWFCPNAERKEDERAV